MGGYYEEKNLANEPKTGKIQPAGGCKRSRFWCLFFIWLLCEKLGEICIKISYLSQTFPGSACGYPDPRVLFQ